jgi:hypothetical protein
MLDVTLWDGPPPCSNDDDSSYISFEPCDVWFDGGFHFDVNVPSDETFTGMSAGRKGEPKYFDVSAIQSHIDAHKRRSEETIFDACVRVGETMS